MVWVHLCKGFCYSSKTKTDAIHCVLSGSFPNTNAHSYTCRLVRSEPVGCNLSGLYFVEHYVPRKVRQRTLHQTIYLVIVIKITFHNVLYRKHLMVISTQSSKWKLLNTCYWTDIRSVMAVGIIFWLHGADQEKIACSNVISIGYPLLGDIFMPD